LTPSTFTKVSVDIFGRRTQRSQTVKEKSVYLKEQLAFGAWDLDLRLGLTPSGRRTQHSQGQRAKPTYFRWVLLSLVTWLGLEPMALKPVRIDSLLIFTIDVDDL